jgi:hypothetical protein
MEEVVSLADFLIRMMSEKFSRCPTDLSQSLTIGLNLKFPAKTLHHHHPHLIPLLQRVDTPVEKDSHASSHFLTNV